MEKKTTYLGTQSDFHTHAHDLPPQMGMCVASNSKAQMQTASEIDGGLGVANHFQYETSVAKEEGGNEGRLVAKSERASTVHTCRLHGVW